MVNLLSEHLSRQKKNQKIIKLICILYMFSNVKYWRKPAKYILCNKM